MIEMCVMRHRARGFIIQIGLRTQPPQKDWARLLEMSAREALRCEVLLRGKSGRRRRRRHREARPDRLGRRAAGGGRGRRARRRERRAVAELPAAAVAAARLPRAAAAASSLSTSTPRCLSQENLNQSFSRAQFEQSRPILLRRLSMKADLKE